MQLKQGHHLKLDPRALQKEPQQCFKTNLKGRNPFARVALQLRARISQAETAFPAARKGE